MVKLHHSTIIIRLCADQIRSVEQAKQRDQDHLGRKEHAGDDREKEQAAPAERELGEDIAGKHAERDRGDGGLFLLPPPVDALREFLLLPVSADVSMNDLRIMSKVNPGKLFKLQNNLTVAEERTSSIL